VKQSIGLLVSAIVLSNLILAPRMGWSDEDLEPSDPIAAIDGEPVYLGELNLILTERLNAKDLDRVQPEVKQATAVLLLRRHLALRSLRQDGGEALQEVIQRQLESLTADVKRRGSSLEAQAKLREADEKSLIADMSWRTAWAQYLKSKMTDENLKLFFQKQPDRYGGKKWEVSQIFIKMSTKDAESVEATRERMMQLVEEIRGNGNVAESFAEAARQHSDGGTAADGGKVGWVEKDGDLPSSVMAAVRSTMVGEFSQPIQSPLGMHLVLVHDSQTQQTRFEDLTDQSQLRRDASGVLFDSLLSRQKDAKVTWFIQELQPPPNVNIVP
jgi:parvulin-like peptidyl-prolyl isomerase